MTERASRLSDTYEVWGRIGEGGMSEVWLAKHAVLPVPVIVKTLTPAIANVAGDAGARRMFNEARMMARVTDPRVVRAIDAGFHEGRPYLVQEYADGLDLAELDRERGRAFGVGLRLWFVCEVMSDACRALHSAHQVGVVHRDVKPSNLFLAPDGIRLGDFGIAIALDESGAADSSGTLKFMAPEQLRGEAVSAATDVFGAGAMAFALRYGRAPFLTVEEVLDPAARPLFRSPISPAEAYFQHLLGGMLSNDRAARPPDLANAAQHFALLGHALRPATQATVHASRKEEYFLGDCTVALRVGNIADERVDAIVSSAPFEMTMRSGSSEALRARGGDVIEEEAMSDGPQPLGACVVTTAGALDAKNVIHAVSAWNETSCIGRALHRALLKAEQLGHRSLAVPALGTGKGRVTMANCAHAMTSALRWHLAIGGSRLRELTVVLGDETKLKTFRAVAEETLRGFREGLGDRELGLPIEEAGVAADGPTFYNIARTHDR